MITVEAQSCWENEEGVWRKVENTPGLRRRSPCRRRAEDRQVGVARSTGRGGEGM